MYLITIAIFIIIFLVFISTKNTHLKLMANIFTSIFMWYGMWTLCDWIRKVNDKTDDHILVTAVLFTAPAILYAFIYPDDLSWPQTPLKSLAYHF